MMANQKIELTLQQASKVIDAYSKFIDENFNTSFNQLNLLFLMGPPDSCLPYPKHIIQEALNTLEKKAQENGNDKMLRAIEGGKAILHSTFISDEEAFDDLIKNINDKTIISTIKSSLQLQQKDNLDKLLRDH